MFFYYGMHVVQTILQLLGFVQYIFHCLIAIGHSIYSAHSHNSFLTYQIHTAILHSWYVNMCHIVGKRCMWKWPRILHWLTTQHKDKLFTFKSSDPHIHYLLVILHQNMYAHLYRNSDLHSEPKFNVAKLPSLLLLFTDGQTQYSINSHWNSWQWKWPCPSNSHNQVEIARVDLQLPASWTFVDPSEDEWEVLDIEWLNQWRLAQA